ncbi:MAG: hypothetical protein OCC45_00420 [Desulfotalea sp.]
MLDLSRPKGSFDIWIQAASGGEAKLVVLLVEELAKQHRKPIKILLTSGTLQGVEVLEQSLQEYDESLTIRYFPLDAPMIMEKAFRQFQPKIAIIIETELWPGFLLAAKLCGCETMLVNGRLSVSSRDGYRKFKTLLKSIGPMDIMAMSHADRDRFCDIFDDGRVSLMNNIKFCSVAGKVNYDNSKLDSILKKPLIILGSIRRQEEEKIVQVAKELRERKPSCQIAIFPKHIERAGYLIDKLLKEGVSCQLRSTANKSCDVIIWDLFGELSSAYGYAQAAFVGGSLENLGGHNFLEPLSHGLRPIIGPYWTDFYWIGDDVFTKNYVLQVNSSTDLAMALLTELDSEYDREERAIKAYHFFHTKQDGCLEVSKKITSCLRSS